jgi:hypothetical protein
MKKRNNVLLAQMESADEELFSKKNLQEPKELPTVKIIKLRKSEEGFNYYINIEIRKNNTLPLFHCRPIP